jgi:hypothetical protein
VKTRSHGVDCQLAREGDLVVTEPAHLAHQEHISIDGIEAAQRLAKHRGERLGRRRGHIVRRLHLRTFPAIVSHVVQREVSRNPEQPRPASTIVYLRDLSASDTQKHLLRQLARILLPDDAAEIAEEAVSVRGEQDLGVCHGVTLSNKDTGGSRSSQTGVKRVENLNLRCRAIMSHGCPQQKRSLLVMFANLIPFLFSFVFLLFWVGLTVYLIFLAKRLVEAVERIAGSIDPGFRDSSKA